MLERFGHVRMASVGIGRIEESQPLVVAIEQQFRKAFEPERSLIRVTVVANRARPHGKPAGIDAGLSQHHRV